MKQILLVLAVALTLFAGAAAQERLALTTPKPLPTQVTGYTISKTCFTVEPTPQILIVLKGEDGAYIDQVYEGSTAATLIMALNKANLSTRSLNQRIFDRLIADGKLIGSVAGSVP